jgi:hypothetical protein
MRRCNSVASRQGSPEQPDAGRVLTEQAQQDAQRRALSRTVGPEEAVYLTAFHREIQPIEHPRFANDLTRPCTWIGPVISCLPFAVGHHRVWGAER